ncbi:MAG TPA: PKD domain-containing protein [Candidatus Eisenbacteria bacterium]|nr:PKD domain-containing protein [Candidatus Eisenbacteria bacterium]
MDEVIRVVDTLRRRYRWVLGVDLFLEFAFVLTAAAGALLLLDRIAYELQVADLHATRIEHVLAAFGTALGVAAIAAVVGAMSRRIAEAGLAWRADKALGSDERVLTALENSGNGASGFAPLLVAQATASLKRADPRRIFPAIPVGYRWGTILALAVGALLAAAPAKPHAPPPVAGFSVTPVRGPAPLRVLVEDSSQGRIRQRTWDFGDGARVEGLVNAVHVYAAPGTYVIKLTLEGPGGSDVATLDRPVEVLAPNAAFADFSADPRKGRAPLEVKFANFSKNAGAFAWNFGDGKTSAEKHPLHRYEEPGLYTVKLEARGEQGTDRVERRAFIKVVGPDAPLADFQAYPRKGEAPLEVVFTDRSSGRVTEWEWDFGDRTPGAARESRERNPAHVYRMPGRYTVRLRARGPGGEDMATKDRYIEVLGDGLGGGGGGGGDQGGPGPAAAAPAAGDNAPSKIFGDESDRPSVTLEDHSVKGRPTGDALVEKEKKVYTGEKEGAAGPTSNTYENVYGEYRRAAEDAMNREQIPPLLRDYVKRYFDRIRPR